MIVVEVREIGAPWGVTAPMLRQWLAQDTVQLLIDTTGGSAMEALSLVEVIRGSGGRVSAHVQGMAASAGAMLLMACERRTASPGSLMLVHRASGCACGDAHDLGELAGIMQALDQRMIGLLSYATGWPQQRADAAVAAGTTWNADEAARVGVIQTTTEVQMHPTIAAGNVAGMMNPVLPMAAVPAAQVVQAQAAAPAACPVGAQVRAYDAQAVAMDLAAMQAAGVVPQGREEHVRRLLSVDRDGTLALFGMQPVAQVQAQPQAAAAAPAQAAPVVAAAQPPVETFGNFSVPQVQVQPAQAAPAQPAQVRVQAQPQAAPAQVQPQTLTVPVPGASQVLPGQPADPIGAVAEAVVARLQGATAAATAAPAIAQAAPQVQAAQPVQGVVQAAAAPAQPGQVVVGPQGQPTHVVVAPSQGLQGVTAHAAQATQAVARGPDGQPLTPEEIAADAALLQVWPDEHGGAADQATPHERLGRAFAEVMQSAVGGAR